MIGTIKKTKGYPKAHDFEIEGEDGQIYFAHIGDIKDNEQLLYNNSKTISLNTGDTVVFTPVDLSPRAINIAKNP